MRVLTGTLLQMQAAAARINALLRLPNGATKTERWAALELLDDGVTWALPVPLKGMLRELRERVQAEGVDAVLVGTGVTRAQAVALLDAIRDAPTRRTLAEKQGEDSMAMTGAIVTTVTRARREE